MKTPILFFSFFWVLCFSFLIHLLFFPDKRDQKSYEDQLAYIRENSSKTMNHPILQIRKNITKEIWSEDFECSIFARESKWFFDLTKKIFQEEFTKLKGTIKQNDSVKTIRAKTALFDFHTKDFTLYHCKTYLPYLLEDGKTANVSSSSDKAVIHLDPKALSFELDRTHSQIR